MTAGIRFELINSLNSCARERRGRRERQSLIRNFCVIPAKACGRASSISSQELARTRRRSGDACDMENGL
jgi:hypothetical protein